MSKIHLLLVFLFIGINSADSTLFPHEISEESRQKNSTSDLPLKIFGTISDSNLPIFIYITGDGGWNKFSSALCNDINQKGIPVIALDAQKYFWESRTPEETAADLINVIEQYMREWKKERFMLAGFSFGADIVPFILNRFPAEIRGKAVASILISPDRSCDFEIHLSDMLSMGISKGKYDVPHEIKKSDSKNFTVIFGSDESENTKHYFQLAEVKMKILQGNHHFDNEHEAVANLILQEITNSEIRKFDDSAM